MDDERKIPGGRLARLGRLAFAGVRAGTGMLLDGDGTAAARHAADVLGTLRGLAAKVGQMASYVDGVVPEAQRGAYETAMKGLLAAAPRSSSAEIRRAVENELGGPIDQLFATWDDAPIASASIGQVHRATLADGRAVAVKVQHPGIRKALESDLSNAGMLESVVGLAGGKRFNSKAMLDVVRQRFREELDYVLEAERQRHFRAFHAADPMIVVPAVIDHRSGRTVLTSEFVAGASFDRACTGDASARVAWCETLWRFVFRGNLEAGMFNADPHPGNYLFQDEGRVAFLDFGCVQTISPEYRANARSVHRAAIDGNEPGFRANASKMLHARPGRLESLAHAYMTRCFQPLLASPYRISRVYAASLVDEMKDLALAARSMPSDEFFTLPPEMVFLNRLQFGFYSVLARLDVEVDYAAIERRFL